MYIVELKIQNKKKKKKTEPEDYAFAITLPDFHEPGCDMFFHKNMTGDVQCVI